MKNRSLEYIVTIAEEGQISKAAKKLFVSQPAISRTLKTIEEELGGKLFDRANGKCSPTKLGKVYIDYAKKVIAEEQILYQKIEELMNISEISYGITPSRSKTLSPYVIQRFNKKFPNIQLNLFEDTVEVLEKKLEKSEVDIIFITVDEIPHNFNVKLISKEEIVLTIKKEPYSLESKGIFKPNFRFPWIDITQRETSTFITLKESMRLGQVSRKIFKMNNLCSSKKITVDTIETAQELAINGLGICFCSDLNVVSYSDKLDIFSFGDEPYYWHFSALYSKDHKLSKPLEYLIELYSQAAKQFKQPI